MQDLNVKVKNYKISKIKHKRKLSQSLDMQRFLRMQKPWTIKEKVNKSDFLQIKDFCSLKNSIIKMKEIATKLCQLHFSNSQKKKTNP